MGLMLSIKEHNYNNTSSITDLLNNNNIYLTQLSVPWSVNCNGKFRCYVNVHVTWVFKANGICCIG